MLSEANSLTTLLGKIIARNLMTGIEQPAQVSLSTEIGGSVKFSVGITNPFRTNTTNRTDPNIQPTTVHCKQATVLGHSDQYHTPLWSLDSGTDVPRSGRNIDNRTSMNPEGPIVTTIPYSNSAGNFNILYLVRITSYIA